MSYQEAVQEYVRQSEEYNQKSKELRRLKYSLEDQIDALRKRIDDINAELDKMAVPRWATMAKGLVDDLRAHFPGHNPYFSSPYGLGCDIYLYLGETEGSKYHICIRPGDLSKGEFRVVDWETTIIDFPPNPLGAINALNHPTTPIESVEQIVAMFKEQMKINAEEDANGQE